MSQRGLNARSDFVFEVTDLGRRVAGLSEVERSAVTREAMGLPMIQVPAGSSVDLDLRFASVVEGVLVTGSADVPLHGQCARCLKDFDRDEQIDLMELFLYPDKELDDEEASRVVDDAVDLEPVIRDAVVLDLPFTPLCREDCEGLCSLCGADLNADPEHDHGEQIDSRWAGLSGLLDD
jgi:uncharacterized protein